MHRHLLNIASWLALQGMVACTGPIETETYPLAEDVTTLRVESRTGDIVVRDAGDEPPRVVATIEGERTRVRSALVDGRQRYSVDCAPAAIHCSVQFEIFLPPELSLELSSESGNLTIGPLEVMDASLASGSGDIDVEGIVTDRLALESGSGDVHVVDAEAIDVIAESGSGNVALHVTAPATNLEARSGSGNVVVTLPQADYDVTAQSGSGDARVSGLEPVTGATSIVVATSDSGDVEVRSGG